MHHRIDSTLRFTFVLLGAFFLFVLYAGDRKTETVPAEKTTAKKNPGAPAAAPPPGYYERLSGFDLNGVYKDPVGDTSFKEIALTFDIGNLAAGGYILNVLKEEGVKATFFLANNQSYKVRGYKSNGDKIFHRTLEETDEGKDLRKILIRMANEGHEVGNHTWSHHNWTRGVDVGNVPFHITKKLFHRELRKVYDRYYEVTGKKLAPIWRSPFGACDMKVKRWAEEAGYSHIFWSKGMDSLDWTDSASAAATLELMKRNAKPGGVYLFHLGNALRTRPDRVHTILRDLIRWLKSQGYTPVTVTELLDGKPNTRPVS